MDTPDPTTTRPSGPCYRIEIAGHLGRARLEELGCTEHRRWPDGRSSLTVVAPDQAALHGTLARLRDLGIPLLALHRLPATPERGGRRAAPCPPSSSVHPRIR
ncbi:MAG: hypothetical protein U0869_09090 [Chloroflexota bacterium]